MRLPRLLPGGVGRPPGPSRICTTCSNHSKVKPQNSLSWGTYNRQTWETGSEQREEPGPRAPGPGWQGPRAPVHEPGRQVCGLRGCEDPEGPIHGHSAVLHISVWTDTDAHEYTHRYKATHRCTQTCIQTHICTQYTHKHSDTQGCTWANTDTHRCTWIHTEIHRYKIYTQRCTGTQMYTNTQIHSHTTIHVDTEIHTDTQSQTNAQMHADTCTHIPQYSGTCTHRHGHMYMHVSLCAH